MRAEILLILVACALAVGLGAMVPTSYDYDSAWKAIDKLQSEGLPKSMAGKVDSLYAAALREGKTDQQIKALIYQLMILQSVEEFSPQKAIEKVREQLVNASEPSASILHSMLAQLYWSYYQSNRYRFGERTETVNFVKADIATWDLKTITKETINEYSLSLANASVLQKYSIADYPEIVVEGGTEERLLRPTLYDFLAHKALVYYTNDESGLTIPFEEFSLADPALFQAAGGFIRMKFSSPDSLSLKYQAIVLYQDLIRFHLEDKEPGALIDVDLERLSFVYDKGRIEDSAKLYESSLRNIMAAYGNEPAATLAIYKLAVLYNSLAEKYIPKVAEDYLWYRRDALRLCLKSLEQFPTSYGAKCCRALASTITAPSLDMSIEAVVVPGTASKALINIKNLSGIKVRVYRVPHLDLNAEEYNEDNYWTRDDEYRIKNLLRKQALWTRTFRFKNEGDYRSHSYEVPLAGFPAGHYIVIASNIGDDAFKEGTVIGYSLYDCSKISYAVSNLDGKTLMLMNRNTGEPISGALVRVFSYNYNRKKELSAYELEWSGESNAQGVVTIINDDRNSWNKRLMITSGADSLIVYGFYGYERNMEQSLRTQTLMFADRAIYRPGQTVYVKGIVYQTDGEKKYKLLPDKQVRIVLRDANYQEVSNQTLKTNEYATFNTTFTLPKNVLTGVMTLEAGDGSVSFSVEEYKRPRFEVSLDEPKDTFKLGQQVTLKGKALTYAGFPVDNSQVSYHITRQAVYPRWFWWWGSWPDSPQKEIAHGTAMTDAQGEFSLTFLAAGDKDALSYYDPYFSFKISVDVTDIGGETRSGSLLLSVGEKELLLDPVVAEKIDLKEQKLMIPVYTTNLSGSPVSAEGSLSISQLQAPDRVIKDRLWGVPDRTYLRENLFRKLFPHDAMGSEGMFDSWKVGKQVWKAQFKTPEVDTVNVSEFKAWKPGVYVLEAVSMYNGQEIRVKKYFTVYDSGSKDLPYPLADWVVPVKTVCEPGEQAQILIGSGYKDVTVLFEIEKDHRIIESKRIRLNNSQTMLTIPVREEDRGSFYAYLTFVRDGRLYSHSQEITVPWTNKQISFEYMTFRDKLLPGQKEEWRLKLKDHTGGKVTAEVLASMYDASLDAFRVSPWYASVYNKVQRSCGWANSSFAVTDRLNVFGYYFYDDSYPDRSFDDFNWYSYYLQYGWGYGYGRGGRVMYDMAAPAAIADKVGSSHRVTIDTSIDGMSVSDAVDIVALDGGMGGGKPQEKADLSGVQARVNFAETAFFYPELRTDEAGDVSFVFTVPESLTKWKFRALALSKDFKIGMTENGTVTQKPLMVMPNAPRFFREGDKFTFTAKISSLDQTDQTGKCQLYLFDAITMEPLDSLFKLSGAQQSFSVRKGESTVLSWYLDVPFGIGAVTYRVVAKAGDFSDGEENTLPVLSNRMLVTESLPLPVSGNSTKTFIFEKLKNSVNSTTIRNHKLTLEYTSNPAWYAVQALPYLMEYPYECNEQIFSRFYANSLASHIANSNPRIKRVFEAWRDTPNSTALQSNLEKNEELKSVLLQETPWVLDAKNESQSKQRIGLLFDLNNMTNQYDNALIKLQKNQSRDGGWPWFPGMMDSWWVSQYIVEGFGHLDHLGVTAIRSDKRVWDMVVFAVDYLDAQILIDYQNILKYGHLEDDNLGYLEMHYLYTRSFFKDLAIPEAVSVAVDYFKNQADKYWLNKDIYGQGLIALARHRDDNKITPQKVVASLKERALHSEELGMWWKGFEDGWFWYQAPIETQALMIEVFTDVAKDTPAVDELRTWLLKQKQTTNWKTTKATAEACYALLISGTEWLNTEKLAEITIGKDKIDPTKLDGVTPEAGTGYFKTSWSGSDISPKMADVTVTNPNRVSSWGSLYWQYFEDLDKITTAETPLKLKKQLFIERVTDTGKVLDPISEKTQLKVGDKVIVRIELRSDRDMEYVHMKDMRSAGFEPVNVLSQYKWQDGLGYYEATGDAATNFFIEYLRKGTYVFEYPLRVFNKGDFSNGITTIQCMYAPEFTSHSEGIRVKVK